MHALRSLLRRRAHRCSVAALYPHDKPCQDYTAALDALLLQIGAKVLRWTRVLGQVVGQQDIDEAIGMGYPKPQQFLNLMNAPASAENMRLRALAVQHADLHRCRPY